MWLVTFEEKRVLAVGSYAEDLAVVAGGDVKVPRFVEGQRPDVFRLGIEKDGGLPRTLIVGGGTGVSPVRFACRRRRRTSALFYFINLAIGIRRRIEDAVLGHCQRLHLKLLRLKDGDGLSAGADAINARRRSGGCEDFTLRADCSGPNGARRSARDQLESGCQL